MGKTSHPNFNRADFNPNVWGIDNGKYKDENGTTTFTINSEGNPQINHFSKVPGQDYDHYWYDIEKGKPEYRPPRW